MTMEVLPEWAMWAKSAIELGLLLMAGWYAWETKGLKDASSKQVSYLKDQVDIMKRREALAAEPQLSIIPLTAQEAIEQSSYTITDEDRVQGRGLERAVRLREVKIGLTVKNVSGELCRNVRAWFYDSDVGSFLPSNLGADWIEPDNTKRFMFLAEGEGVIWSGYLRKDEVVDDVSEHLRDPIDEDLIGEVLDYDESSYFVVFYEDRLGGIHYAKRQVGRVGNNLMGGRTTWWSNLREAYTQ